MNLGITIIQVWRQARLSEKIALVILVLWVLVAVLNPLLVGSHSWALVPYDYDQILGVGSALLPPLSDAGGQLHLLGTDSVGRDVAAGMIHGARVSFLVSVFTVLLSLAIGLLIGVVMGYFGDRGLKVNIPQVLWIVFISVVVGYYKTDILFGGWSWFSAGMTLLCTILLFSGWGLMAKLPLKKYPLFVDTIWQRVFEVKESLPNLFLILAIGAVIVKPSIYTLIFTLVMLYWVTFARFARAEMQQLKNEDFMAAAKAEGANTWQLLMRHALPNIMSPIMVVIAFSLSGVILMESSLSFLGLGLPLEEVTWGKLLAEARRSSGAWWLAVFPGLAIFALLYAFNTVADMIRDRTTSR